VWQDYAEISQSGLFTEINVGQGTRLFALHGIAPKPDVETGSAVVRSSQVLEDRAAFVGVCNDGPCKIIVHKPLAPFLSCKGGCHAKANATDTVIGGIGAGPFAVEVEPAHPEFELPALLLFAAVAGAALFLASPHNKTIAV
jgi:hypothetical protein